MDDYGVVEDAAGVVDTGGDGVAEEDVERDVEGVGVGVGLGLALGGAGAGAGLGCARCFRPAR
jgi:hypothetical protein